MPTRTYLTTPPGREPFLDAFDDGVVERWVPGPTVPTEPGPPPRRHPVALTLVVALVLSLLLVVAIRLVTDAQSQDPALGASAGQG